MRDSGGEETDYWMGEKKAKIVKVQESGRRGEAYKQSDTRKQSRAMDKQC